MLNQVIIVGRLTSEVEDNKITLAVQRIFKNEEGIYETDFIPVIVQGGIESNMKEYCHKGDIVGIKGRTETREDKVVIIAEKVTFLSSKKKDEE